MGAFPEIHACPKCGRILLQSGEALFDEVRLPVFRCDDCLVEVNVLGETATEALTFTVDEDGSIVGAEEPGARLWA
jgi:hypothetical protein